MSRRGATSASPAVTAAPTATDFSAPPTLPRQPFFVRLAAAGYPACSVYPLSEAVDDPAAVTPELQAYGRNRQAAVAELCERLAEAEEVLHDLLH
ncbi:hypothetical protein OG780_36745 [Streptomyces sp. NBC_00386]|uniref:hypothetical protein n=1 Tax=Streptomyces sp. NBC_00386 TaxID=2975734 RepID=UPI002E201F25